MALHRIADDPAFDAYVADGLVRLEQLLASHACFGQYDSDALDRLIEAISRQDRSA